MNMKIEFPKNFWWGAATSGPQSEGNFGKHNENIMDYWFKTNPEDFFDLVGPNVASNFYHQYESDLDLLKQIGFNSFRTSIQWTRLIKNVETGEVDQDGVAFYKAIIKKAHALGIELVLNLHHFDLPIELLKKYNGWESKHVVDLFVDYARVAFESFGSDVKYWTTFNEPMVIPEAGYLYGFHYPKYSNKGKEANQIIYNLNLASARTIQLYKEMNLPGKIGIILNLTPAYPKRKEDIECSHFVDNYFNKSFLDPAVKGVFPKSLVNVLSHDGVLWETTEEELEVIGNNTVDFLGVNYYHPKRVKTQKNPEQYSIPWTPDKYFEEYKWEEARMNPYRGWEIYPKAIYDIAKNIQNNYQNIPWFISENGMGVEGEEKYADEEGKIQDDYRIEFYEEHLTWLAKAIDEGSACFGYHTWTAIDCWSWNNAYKNRYGFISINLKTQKRIIKKSGYWYKSVAEKNSFEYDEKI